MRHRPHALLPATATVRRNEYRAKRLTATEKLQRLAQSARMSAPERARRRTTRPLTAVKGHPPHVRCCPPHVRCWTPTTRESLTRKGHPSLRHGRGSYAPTTRSLLNERIASQSKLVNQRRPLRALTSVRTLHRLAHRAVGSSASGRIRQSLLARPAKFSFAKERRRIATTPQNDLKRAQSPKPRMTRSCRRASARHRQLRPRAGRLRYLHHQVRRRSEVERAVRGRSRGGPHLWRGKARGRPLARGGGVWTTSMQPRQRVIMPAQMLYNYTVTPNPAVLHAPEDCCN